MLPRIFGFIMPLCLLAFACGESSAPVDASAEECRAHCEDTCSALAECGTTSDSCLDDCTAGAHNCDRATPPNQLTCAELEADKACSDYCMAFCAEVADCAGFDEGQCLVGCKDLEPMICNAASVGARTCDQLKPEARDYDRQGEALTSASEDDRDVVFSPGYHTPEDFGLCASAEDCAEGVGCSAVTNTCGPCATDAECKKVSSSGHLISRAICTADGSCVAEGCGLDGQCSTSSHPVCDGESLSCVECSSDADCAEGRVCTDRECT